MYVATDHASLVTLLGDQSLADVENLSLARIKERTLWWQFKVIHTPGNLQLAADALSRRKSKLPANLYRLSAKDIEVVEEDIIDDLQLRLTDLYNCSAKILSVMSVDTVKVITWEKLYEAFHEDQVLVKPGLEPARLGGLLRDPETKLCRLTRTILKNWKPFLKNWKSKKSLSTSPFFEGERALEKMGNWKNKFEKLENEMERTLAKIAGSSPALDSRGS